MYSHDEQLMDSAYPEMDKKRRKEKLGLWTLGILERIAKAQQAITRRDIIAELRALPSSNTQEFAIAVAEWITKQEMIPDLEKVAGIILRLKALGLPEEVYKDLLDWYDKEKEKRRELVRKRVGWIIKGL